MNIYSDKLNESLQLCDIHHQRMMHAFSRIDNYFPLNLMSYNNLEADQLSFMDQLIFRFSKLQDSMGQRLFPSLLQFLGENTNQPFIDKLALLEKIGVIDSSEDWLKLRETRNAVVHEYPFNLEEIVEGLNLLHKDVVEISSIWNKVRLYCQQRLEK